LLETWYDHTLRNSRSLTRRDGWLIIQYASTIHGRKWDSSTVNYSSRTWSTVRRTLSDSIPAWIGQPESYQTIVSSSEYSVVGRERIGGRPALHVTRSTGGTVSSRSDLWLDVSSYLPIRKVTITKHAGRTMRTDTRFDWLPRTPANLAKTVLQVPAGFKNVTGPPGQVTTGKLAPAMSA
jgi:hypothetical protein